MYDVTELLFSTRIMIVSACQIILLVGKKLRDLRADLNRPLKTDIDYLLYSSYIPRVLLLF